MNFDEFKAEFMKENRKLKIIIAVAIVIFSIGSFSTLTERKYYLYKGQAIFDERPLAEEVCRVAFLGLTEGNPNPFVVAEGILQLVKKEPFTLTVDKILKLSSTEVGSCKIIIKSAGKLMAFNILLEAKESNPFFYKLNEIQEITPGEEG